MEEFVTTQRFEDHVKESESRYSEIRTDIKVLYEKAERMVPHSQFKWIIGILISLIVGLAGYLTTEIRGFQASIDTLYNKIDQNNQLTQASLEDLYKSVSQNNQTTAYIKGVLDNSQITK